MSRAKRRLMGEMNVVPYIDVMLVLLIIFMITAPLLEQGVTVDLPDAPAAPVDPELLRENEPVILSVDAEGNYYLNLGEDPESPKDVEMIRDMAAAVFRRNPETPALVKGDGAALYHHVMTGFVLLQQAGARQLNLLADPIPQEVE